MIEDLTAMARRAEEATRGVRQWMLAPQDYERHQALVTFKNDCLLFVIQLRQKAI